MSLSVGQKSALEIQRGILQAEDDIVLAVQDALNKTTTYGNLEESQFRNLVRVADSTESTEAIKNFLRYQTGRDNKWGTGKNSLAEKLIEDFEQLLKKQATDIANKAKTEDIKSIHIKLIRLYLGYGARHLKYLKPSN
ncbi:MAG: hypothetical protein AAF378_12305 [Cyanobacteria bacterium P01_A01_bin.84]